MVTTNNQTIIKDTKITAQLGIIDNGVGNRNYITDAYNGYEGFIGIEIRGYSSSGWSDKKPYGFETRDELGENNNVSLLGMPSENDWVLHSPQADKTLLRNKLIYDIARDMETEQYAPRSRFCEVVIDGNYRGVYVLVEKIKKDKNRVDLEKNKVENITGGFLVEMTPEGRIKDDEVSFKTNTTKASLVVKYPDEEDITAEQLSYISTYFNEFESALFGDNLTDETLGYAKYIDVPSFIDHILISECFHQLDGLTASQYFHKKQDGKLFMGPVWDFNRSMGNVNYYGIYEFDMWWMLNSRGNARTPYVNQLMTDPAFMKLYAARWFQLREGVLSLENITARIDNYVDLLDEAKDRNFARWPDMLETSYKQYYVYDLYDAYITQIKDWVENKFLWLDTAFDEYVAGLKISNSSYSAFEFEEQKGNFKIAFDWSPQEENMDGVFALADISNGIDAYSDLACITRLNNNGQIDVRSGGTYTKDGLVNYEVDEYYHVVMEVDINSHTYNVFVTPKSTDITIQVASNYAFRSDQSNIEKLNGFVMKSSDGSYKLKNFCLNDACNAAPLSIDKNTVTDFSLKSYPNPFTESATIVVEQTEDSYASINIYSIDGKLLHQIYNGRLNKGVSEFKWNGNQLGTGIYYCSYVSNGKHKTFKIVKTN
jgi:hypothetical protein